MPTVREVNRNHPTVRKGRGVLWLIAGSLILAAASLAAPSAYAAEDHATVAGRVLDPLGGAIPDAAVALVRDGQPVSEAKSDEQGRFALSSNRSEERRVGKECRS